MKAKKKHLETIRMSAFHETETVRKAKQSLADGREIIFFDLETTGVHPDRDRIVSFSAIRCGLVDGVLTQKEELDFLSNPGIPIPKGASDVNMITDDMVKGCPDEGGLVDIVDRFFRKGLMDKELPILAGYNSRHFDIPLLQNAYRRHEKELKIEYDVDVLLMAREKLDIASRTLISVSQALGVDKGITFHNSLDDVRATIECYKHLDALYAEEEPKNLQRIAPLTCWYWNIPNTKMQRIYVMTDLYRTRKTYYDIYKKEWRSEILDLNLPALEEDCFLMAQTDNISDFVRTVKAFKR